MRSAGKTSVSNRTARRPLALSLEPRLLFDGAVAASLTEAAVAEAASDTPQEAPQAADVAASSGTADTRPAIAFVDSRLPDYSQLAAAVAPGTEVVILDARQDGLQQIADYLQGRSGIETIHLLSHGSAGRLVLGATDLDARTLDTRAADLAALGRALSAGGDLLLYGCQVAEGEAGRAFVNALVALTGADVAASTDWTGASHLGGNWTLEYAAGEIGRDTILGAANAMTYDQLLSLNSAPTDIMLANTTIAENSIPPANVGTLTTIDPDAGDVFTYQVVGGADQAAFEIVGNTLRFTASTTLNYEAKASYSVTIRTTDGGGLSHDKTFTISITDLNEGPTSVALASQSLSSSTATAGAVVGTLTANDPDPADTHIFSLAMGNGTNDADNGKFAVVGNTLRVGASALSAGTYRVLVRGTDPGGYYVNQALTIVISAANEAPALTLDSGSASFVENGNAITISPGATVSDSEGNWNGGHVTLSLTANGSNSDLLGLDTQGAVSLSGTTVSVGGLAIGTLSAGSGTFDGATVSGSSTASLVVTLNANATDAHVQALVRALVFANTSEDPSGATRTLSVTVADNAASGGATTATREVTVIPVNDAPTLSGPPHALPATDEDTASTPITVATLLAAFSSGDIDGDTLGIAVTSVTGDGQWQYSADGTTWTGLGQPSVSEAILLDPTTQLRYLPVGAAEAAATLGFVAWDRSTGSASATSSPSSADASVQGGTTAFSSTAATVQIRVDAVNDAPVLADTPLALTLDWNLGLPSGASGIALGELLGGASDPDGDTPLGIAITGSDETLGQWYYTTDGGNTWLAVGAVSAGNALHLADDGNTRLYLAPQPNTAGDVGNALTFVAWDRSAGTAGGRSALVAGSVSTASDSLSISIVETPVAPELTPAGPSFSTIDEDATANPGQTVASLLGAQVSDPNSGALQGIAITAADAGRGHWEYSLDGSSWVALGAVSDASALLLRAVDYLRFVPDGEDADSASITYRAWDQSGATAGQQGSQADARTHGGASAFSSASDTATLTVTAINDAPTLASAATPLPDTRENAPSTAFGTGDLLLAASYRDVDSGALAGVAITGLSGSGRWQFSVDGGTSWRDIGGVSETRAALFDATTQLRYLPAEQGAETATLQFVAWDRTTGTASDAGSLATADASLRGGATAFSTLQATATLAVTESPGAPATHAGDPQYLSTPSPFSAPPDSAWAPTLPDVPPAASPSPMAYPSLLEAGSLGSGLPTSTALFQRDAGALAGSFLAQIFASHGAGPAAGGPDPLDHSTLAELFRRAAAEPAAQGGAPSLDQQLKALGEGEQKALRTLTAALSSPAWTLMGR